MTSCLGRGWAYDSHGIGLEHDRKGGMVEETMDSLHNMTKFTFRKTIVADIHPVEEKISINKLVIEFIK